MEASTENITELREMLGESLPEGGTEADSMFTNTQITTWLEAAVSIEAAALKGWRVKMAHYANLVNVTDGAASRELSDLMTHAQEMVTMYTRLARGITWGRTRVGKIRRP